jgi:broad specificity phosphatase PhoE
VEDARRVASQIAGAQPFAALYTSPLRRAFETASSIAAVFGLVTIPLPDAGEIRCGVLDGAPLEMIQKEHAEVWAQNVAQDDDGFRWPGGESYAEFRQRVRGAFSDISRSHAGDTVIVVTHAGVIAQVIGILKGITAARWDVARPAHGAVTEIRWGSGGPESAVAW